jgi:hypothetical protein
MAPRSGAADRVAAGVAIALLLVGRSGDPVTSGVLGSGDSVPSEPNQIGLSCHGVPHASVDTCTVDLDEHLVRSDHISPRPKQRRRPRGRDHGCGRRHRRGQHHSPGRNRLGADSYDGTKLQSVRATITISGVGSAAVWVTHDLSATVSGVGNIDNCGSPQVTESVSGVGSINDRGDG